MIDPREKGFDWILQYVKAAYKEVNGYMPAFMGNLARSKYAEIREYAMGKQSISKYKKAQPGTAITDNEDLTIDSNPLAILPKFREIAVAKLMQRNYDIQAYAVDALSKTEEDSIFNEMKIKVMMREAAQKSGSPLADSPLLKRNSGEPEDMDELSMQKEYSFKHILCMEAEEGIQLVMQQNNIEEERKRNIENFVDYGIGYFKDWIDENGKECFRAVDMQNFMCSYCIRPDFKDMVHAGEFQEVWVGDLAPYFNETQMEFICKRVAGKYGNPSSFTPTGSRWWNRFKVRVLDFQFLSWNTYIYGTETDSRDNDRYGKLKVDYANAYQQLENPQGQATPKYTANTKKVVYKCKWIVDTDMMYDYGLSENQYRKQSSWWDTKLDYIGYAWNFNRMVFSGLTERAMPIADAIQLTWQKLQNLKNKLIPYLIELDMTALEAVAMGKGGLNMKPDELIDFAFNNFILLYRSNDLITERNPNYQAMRIHASGQLQAFAQLYEDLNVQIDLMRQVWGLNELTDGSTPNAKTLIPVADAAIQSTNNALYLISNGEKQLMQRLADQIMCKVQIAVKLGKVEGYLKPLGSQTVKFLSINPDISLREFGIFLEDVLSDAQKEMLYSELNAKETQGIILPQDKIIVMSCRNLKQARIYLAYITNKRMDENRQFELQKIQQQVQGNAQVAAATTQMQQQTILLQAKVDIEKINAQMQWQYIIESMKKASDKEEAHIQGQAKLIAQQIQGQAKVISQTIAAEAQKESASKRTA